MTWKLVYTKQARKDAEKIKAVGLKIKVQRLLQLLEEDPFHNLPHYEKLLGDLCGAYSLRINIQYRLIYQIYQDEKTIKIIRIWTRYE